MDTDDMNRWDKSFILWHEYDVIDTWLRPNVMFRIVTSVEDQQYYITARAPKYFAAFKQNRIGPFDTLDAAVDAADMMYESGTTPDDLFTAVV